MHYHEPNNYLFWPERRDVSLNHVLTRISISTVSGSSGRQYKMDDEGMKKVRDSFKIFKTQLA